MSDIFVSYASEDRERVKSLVEALLTEGWSIWWDRELVAGPRFDEEIEKALNDAQCVVVVWSEHSVTSRWCRDEASEGLERQVLVPVRIDNVRPPIGFRSAQTASLLDWPDSRGELNSLLFGIRRYLGVPTGDVGARARALDQWVAVLPFARDTDSEEAFFSEGLAEDLIDRLAATELKVIARTSSFQLNDDSGSFQEIGRRLGVSHLVTGCVRRAGEYVRVNIRLMPAMVPMSGPIITTADSSTSSSCRTISPPRSLPHCAGCLIAIELRRRNQRTMPTGGVWHNEGLMTSTRLKTS